MMNLTKLVLAGFWSLVVPLGLLSQSFPLPYNPDENGDGLIGVADLQGLLSQYGSEFSSATLAEDGESALVFVGDLAYPVCVQSCANLPGRWNLPTLEDLGIVWDEVGGTQSQNSTNSIWIALPEGTQNYNQVGRFSNYQYAWGISQINFGDQNGNVIHECYCAARQLPRVEYFTCTASCSDGAAALDACVNEKLSEGWYPLNAQRQQQVYSTCFWPPLWRWAD